MNIEVWIRDEYGRGSIMGRYSSHSEAWERALTHLYAVNCDNALTLQERLKSWECYMPVVVEDGKLNQNAFFDENVVGRKPRFFTKDGLEMTIPGTGIMMLANNLKCDSPWFVEDIKKRPVKSIEDATLRGKSYITFKKV